MNRVRRYSLQFQYSSATVGVKGGVIIEDRWCALLYRNQQIGGSFTFLQEFLSPAKYHDEEHYLTEVLEFLRQRGERVIGMYIERGNFTIFTELVTETAKPAECPRCMEEKRLKDEEEEVQTTLRAQS